MKQGKIQKIAIDEHFQLEIRTPNCASISYNVGPYNVAVRAIKEFRELSEETLAFCGSLYVNGRKAGRVRNGGFGGSCEIDWDNLAVRNDFLRYFEKERIRVDSIISNLVAANLDMTDTKLEAKKLKMDFSFGGFVLTYKKDGGFWA